MSATRQAFINEHLMPLEKAKDYEEGSSTVKFESFSAIKIS